MARFYAQYQNVTQSDLEQGSGSNWYNKKTVNTTNAGTARTSIISTRAALSASFYSTIAAQYQNGTLGIVVPSDGFTNNGTTISGDNIYTDTSPSPGAIWQSDPRIRPIAPIFIANTESTIADNFSVPVTEYNAAADAVQAYMNAITDGSPYARIGLNPYRTLASIWHDHAMTYFAWDDFTPGQVQGLTASWLGDASAFTINADWSSYQYTNDENTAGKIRVEFTMGSLTGGNNYSYDTGLITPPSTKTVQWQFTPVANDYLLNIYVRLYDATISTHYGAYAYVVNQAVTVPASGSPTTGNGGGSGGAPPIADPFQDPVPTP